LQSRNFPFFLFLLPLFFVLHGMNEQAGFVPVSDAFVLLLVYLLAAVILFFLCRLLFRNNAKAALASFSLMAFHLFFGSIHDALKIRYSIILPLSLIIFIIAFVLIKKKQSFERLRLYLNVLFIVLIAWEGINFFIPKKSLITTQALTICDTCNKPDIYLIVLDEYAGAQSQKELFGFDNIAFETQLNQRGFHIVRNSRSNYNYTPFSMASMLNMSYLQLQNTERKKPDLSYALRLINDNYVRQMLVANGYEFFNHSGFDLAGQPTPIEETFMPIKTKLITAQTFLSRIKRDLGYHLLLRLNPSPSRAYRELHNNTKLYDLTMKIASQPHQKPRFVYTHLMMPHYPYYFDRNGKAMDPARVLPEANNANKKDYIEYLQYTNNKILQLTDHILKTASKPPVIIIMSDHGFRHFTLPVAREYHFMNLNTIYLPAKNYAGFYDSMSNVNQFRVLFNIMFKSQFPMLKDSSIYLKD
jgi:hypothetical protein